MTHRQEPETATEHHDRETPESAVSGSLSVPRSENGAQDAGMPERAAGGRVGRRTQLNAAIRPFTYRAALEPPDDRPAGGAR